MYRVLGKVQGLHKLNGSRALGVGDSPATPPEVPKPVWKHRGNPPTCGQLPPPPREFSLSCNSSSLS